MLKALCVAAPPSSSTNCFSSQRVSVWALGLATWIAVSVCAQALDKASASETSGVSVTAVGETVLGDFIQRAASYQRTHRTKRANSRPAAKRSIEARGRILQAIHHMARRQRTLGLSELQLRERLNQLQELHILPEHRVQSSLQDPERPGEESA